MNPSISIIIPARSDAKALSITLGHLEHLDGIETAEILVAAAGDREETERAVAGRARLLWPNVATRAELMNAGASQAHGNVLFFLHADSFPPRGALQAIHKVCKIDVWSEELSSTGSRNPCGA